MELAFRYDFLLPTLRCLPSLHSHRGYRADITWSNDLLSSEVPKLASLRCHVIQTGNHEAAMRYAGYDRADESVKHLPGANQKSRITKVAWVGRSVVTYTKYGST